MHLVARAIAIHVYSAVFVQFLHKFRSQLFVQMLWEISQRIAQSESFLLRSEDILALRSMVYLFVIRHCLWQ